MKTKKMQWLAVLLAVVLLCSGVPLLTAGAAENDVITAKVTKATLTSMESFVVGGSDRGAVYQIALYLDQEVYIADEANYWRQNLQQNGGGCSETHKERANLIRAHMSINGVTVEDDLKAGTDHTNSTMVATPSDTEKNKLTITIRKAENHYGISDTEDFTLQITDGITLNGVALSAMTMKYCASTKQLFVVNGSVAHVTGLQLEEPSTSCDNNCYQVDHWSMVFWTDQPVTPTLNASYYRKHLTVAAASSTDGMSLVGVALRKRILINGKNLDECISASGNGEYKALHVQAGQQTSGAKKSFIRISIPKDNQYGFDGQNFEITFLDGIILNGYALAPQKIVYPEKTVPITYDGAGASAPAADGSSALRFKFTLTCAGVSYADATHADGNYQRNPLDGSSKVTASGKEYTLVDFGAIVSNKTGDNLTLGSVDKKWILQVPARNLYDVGDGTVTYTARVMGVPSNRFDRILYARAYATVSDGESTWTLYGETVESCIQALLSASPTE